MTKADYLYVIFLLTLFIFGIGGTIYVYQLEKDNENKFTNFCIKNNFDGLANKYIKDNIEYIRISNNVLVELKNKLYVPCYEHTLINRTIKTEYKLIYWSNKK